MLNYEELILLDALAYYGSFSDILDDWEDDELENSNRYEVHYNKIYLN